MEGCPLPIYVYSIYQIRGEVYYFAVLSTLIMSGNTRGKEWNGGMEGCGKE
tara:strand:+ start:366 stop:518 length:153 start_codon:yes stop_codon:yes gene_type:complete